LNFFRYSKIECRVIVNFENTDINHIQSKMTYGVTIQKKKKKKKKKKKNINKTV